MVQFCGFLYLLFYSDSILWLLFSSVFKAVFLLIAVLYCGFFKVFFFFTFWGVILIYPLVWFL